MSGATERRQVGVNLLWLVPGVVGGSEEYTTRLLSAVHDDPPDDIDITLFVLPSFGDAHPDVVDHFPTVVAPVDGRRKPERVAAEATWLAREAGRRHVDLLHHAGGIVPPGPAVARIPSVLTIHDLQPLVHPEHFSPVKRRWLHAMLPRSVHRARLVLTPSDPSSASVVELLAVDASRVRTVPHGIGSLPAVTPARVGEVRDHYRLDGQVVLYPAITYAHKDHRTLVEAFGRLVTTTPDATLALVGGPGPAEAEVAAVIRRSGAGDRIRRTGRVPWDDLEAMYACASVVAFPSRFEGFGAPALEAMAWGVPLVAADATALPWVVGDGGVLVAPGDVGAWAAAIGGILGDPGEAQRLRAAGLGRAAQFTWERAARALLTAYRDALAADEDRDR